MKKRQTTRNYEKELRKKVNQLRIEGKLPQKWTRIAMEELNARVGNFPSVTQGLVNQVGRDKFYHQDILFKLVELSERSNIPDKIAICDQILGISCSCKKKSL